MLLEREHVLARLTALLDESSGGAGRMVFLAGEAGVGKTAVVTALAAAVPAGVRVRSGSCDSITTTAALGPFLDAVPELSDPLDGAEAVEVFSLAESLGGIESLVAHPATMTHASMSPDARRVAGISDSLLRLSIGLEGEADLLADLACGLDAT